MRSGDSARGGPSPPANCENCEHDTMLWTPEKLYLEEPFDVEADLEAAILQPSSSLFGESRLYLDAKRLIGSRGKTRNIPDGYLIDLSSTRDPKLFVVENELAKHEPLRHVAVQILEFSLSFEASPHRFGFRVGQDSAAFVWASLRRYSRPSSCTT